jgi:hypothetical protein
MRSVQTGPDVQSTEGLHDVTQLLEPPAERVPHARGVFEQNAQRGGWKVFGRLFYGFNRDAGRVSSLGVATRAGMHHNEVGAQIDPANKFVMKGLDRPRAKHRLRSREVDEVIRVNDQRA